MQSTSPAPAMANAGEADHANASQAAAAAICAAHMPCSSRARREWPGIGRVSHGPLVRSRLRAARLFQP